MVLVFQALNLVFTVVGIVAITVGVVAVLRLLWRSTGEKR